MKITDSAPLNSKTLELGNELLLDSRLYLIPILEFREYSLCSFYPTLGDLINHINETLVKVNHDELLSEDENKREAYGPMRIKDFCRSEHRDDIELDKALKILVDAITQLNISVYASPNSDYYVTATSPIFHATYKVLVSIQWILKISTARESVNE